MKRGFKSSAEKLAIATRSEIDHDDRERLDLTQLQRYLSIESCGLGEIQGCDEDVAHLHGPGVSDFSAGLVILPGDRRLLIYNEQHSDARLANSIAHEISHVLLNHEPTPGFDHLGNRDWRADDEDEADWLAGCLLAPRSGLISIMKKHALDVTAAAAHYGISKELMRQRWHQTGCAKQLERSR